MEQGQSGFHRHFRGPIAGLASFVALQARRKMFALFEKKFGTSHKVLDVGVTSESMAPEANFFEEMHPNQQLITAVGVEDASHLVDRFPGLKFIQVKEGEKYPFSAGQFEVGFSNAVIEHIVEDSARLEFVKEILRVSKHAFITTPNRYFPVEHHTGIPLVHACWPALFFFLLDRVKISKFYSSKNLRPMNEDDLKTLANQLGRKYEIQAVRILGFKSNLILIIQD